MPTHTIDALRALMPLPVAADMARHIFRRAFISPRCQRRYYYAIITLHAGAYARATPRYRLRLLRRLTTIFAAYFALMRYAPFYERK